MKGYLNHEEDFSTTLEMTVTFFTLSSRLTRRDLFTKSQLV